VHRDELIRATAAMPVAVLMPFCARVLRSYVFRAGLVALFIIAAEAPHLGSGRTWAVVIVGVVATLVAGDYEPPKFARPFAASVLATVLAVIIIDEATARRAIEGIGGSVSVVLIIAGGLAAVFVSGVVIGNVLQSFARAIPQHAVGMENAGRYIGWLERALLYGLFVAGAPDAAALVIAGKSVARFPSFAEEEFAEYYLIGSFLSLGVAAGLGVAVRASISLHPLVPTNL
jgi:hypothetical protein